MPTRYDLMFIADMLGGFELAAIGGLDPWAKYKKYTDDQLADGVARRAQDPIANVRAQQRIINLARQLPHNIN